MTCAGNAAKMKKVNVVAVQKSRNSVSFDPISGEGREEAKMSTIARSEKGVVLVVVLVLSAVVLALMTALIYMVTSGTQISGIQKRYKSSLEAAKGGSDIIYQLVALRGEAADNLVFTNALGAAGLTSSLPILTSACTGMTGGTPYSALQAKLMTPTTSWVNCNSNLAIDPNNSNTYDIMIQLGTTTRYNIYGKIVQTIDGNSGGDLGLVNKGVISGGTGEITVMAKPYMYDIEVVAENSTNRAERAKYSILYQY